MSDNKEDSILKVLVGIFKYCRKFPIVSRLTLIVISYFTAERSAFFKIYLLTYFRVIVRSVKDFRLLFNKQPT